MNLAQTAELVGLLILPSALLGAILQAPRALAAVERWSAERRAARCGPWTYAPPIEQVGADLRRLLVRHAELLGATSVPLRVHRLRALELALAACVGDAERALGLADQEAGGAERGSHDDLRRRLQRLAGAGFALPRHLPLLADDEVS